MTEPATAAPRADDARAARLWAAALRAIGRRSAHELRNALNGAALNLEVVRSRAAKGGDASAVAGFADTAAQQLERVTAIGDGLLAALRDDGDAVDVPAFVRRLTAALGGPDDARAAGAAPGDPPPVPGEVARACLAAAAASWEGVPGGITCETGDLGDILVRVARAAPTPLEAEAAALAADHGIRVSAHADALELYFPPPRPGRAGHRD